MVHYYPEGLPGKDFNPMVHEFKGDVSCKFCGKPRWHHFHTGIHGEVCGCQDCMPLPNETKKLNRPRALFSRIFNR